MVWRHTKKAEQALTVLVVEPRATDLEQTRMTLGEAGFRVVPVTRFDAAGPLFEAIRPDAVVLAAQGPDFARTLDRVSAALTTDAMQSMNAAAGADGADPARIARDFLRSQGLLKPLG